MAAKPKIRVISHRVWFKISPEGEKIPVSSVTVQDELGDIRTVNIDKAEPTAEDIIEALKALRGPPSKLVGKEIELPAPEE